MKLSKNIAILGCGWLGLPLAEHLSSLNYHVKGSTTSKDKIELIKSKKTDPYLIEVKENEIIGNHEFFTSIDVLIIAIPPRLKSNPERRHDLVVDRCIEVCIANNIKEVIFISSTSVYGNQSGSLNEESKLAPSTNSGKQLAICEQKLLETDEFSTTILRMGGLIGDKRHPIIQLSKKKYVDNPKGSINLIHLTDCISIIHQLLNKQITKNVYNCVTPFHPSREKYYSDMALLIGCNQPSFKDLNPIDRVISSAKIIQDLKYTFIVKNLLIFS